MKPDIFDLRSKAQQEGRASLRLEPEADWSVACYERRRLAAVAAGIIIPPPARIIPSPRGGRRQGTNLVRRDIP